MKSFLVFDKHSTEKFVHGDRLGAYRVEANDAHEAAYMVATNFINGNGRSLAVIDEDSDAFDSYFAQITVS